MIPFNFVLKSFWFKMCKFKVLKYTESEVKEFGSKVSYSGSIQFIKMLKMDKQDLIFEEMVYFGN